GCLAQSTPSTNAEPSMNHDLSNRVALVTGGGTGIGAAIVGDLADNGSRVMVGCVDERGADAARRSLDTPSRRLATFAGDLREPKACQAAIDATVSEFGRIDILINCAAVTGSPAVGRFLDFSDADLDAIVEVNLNAVFRCSRHAALHMSQN